MTATEELWFLVSIGGFLLIMEGAIMFMGKSLLKRVPEPILKVVAGFILFIIALVKLFSLPSPQ